MFEAFQGLQDPLCTFGQGCSCRGSSSGLWCEPNICTIETSNDWIWNQNVSHDDQKLNRVHRICSYLVVQSTSWLHCCSQQIQMETPPPWGGWPLFPVKKLPLQNYRLSPPQSPLSEFDSWISEPCTGPAVQQYILIWWGIAIPASLMRPGVERHRTGSGTPIQYSQFVMGQDNSFHQRLMHSDKCAAMQPWNWSSLCEGDFQTTHVLLLACLEGVRVHMAWAVRQWPQLGPSGPQQISIQSLWPTR